jgi:hypothetical protein
LFSATNVFLSNEKKAVSFSGENNVDLAANKIGAKVETLAIRLGVAVCTESLASAQSV